MLAVDASGQAGHGRKGLLRVRKDVQRWEKRECKDGMPGAVVTRLISRIKIFNFDVRRVPGRQHSDDPGVDDRWRLRSRGLRGCSGSHIQCVKKLHYECVKSHLQPRQALLYEP